MKKILILTAALFILALAVSCDSQKAEQYSGLVELSVDVCCEEERALTINAPYTAASRYMYKAEAQFSTGDTTGHTGSSWYSAGNTSTGSLSIVLAAGYWRITVALADTEGNIMFTSNAQTIYVSPASHTLSVTLKPYTSGSGTLAYDITYTPNTTCLGVISCTVEEQGQMHQDIVSVTSGETYTHSDSHSLTPGLYTLSFRFDDSTNHYRAGYSVTVRILNGQTTTVTGSLGTPAPY